LALQDLGGAATIAQVKTHLRLAGRGVEDAMTRLRRKKLAERIEYGIYRVAGSNPVFGSGRSKASQANLRQRPKPKCHRAPRPILEIEKAWGWMPAFSTITNAADED